MKLTVSDFCFFIAIHSIRRLEQLRLGNHSQFDTRSYERFFNHSGRYMTPPKIFTLPPESPCVHVVQKYRLINSTAFVGTFLAAMFT
jgi:hypothetical protein